jgi:hypothetical protein
LFHLSPRKALSIHQIIQTHLLSTNSSTALAFSAFSSNNHTKPFLSAKTNKPFTGNSPFGQNVADGYSGLEK